MEYTAELRFLRRTFSSCNLQTLLIPRGKSIEPRMDLGMRSMIGWTRDYELTLTAALHRLSAHTLYRMCDQFGYRYQFLQLPDSEGTVLWIGPYFDREITREEIMLAIEQYGISPRWMPQMERFFSQIPVIPDNSSIHAMIYNFCCLVWDTTDFDTIDLNRELTGRQTTSFPFSEESTLLADVEQQMKIIEKRYAYENRLLDAVAQGQIQKGSVMLGQLSSFTFEQRTPDALRNMKNYCIIMNTLLRKTAESAGVPPIYLHETSSDFARKIEQLYNTNAVSGLMNDMFYSYCRLVTRHATGHYSLPVQRTIARIDGDLSGDLSLKALAESQKLSPGYLSTLFKEDTGMTITEFVNSRRIRQAIRLLNSTDLQIQTIARHCGIPDVNYFSKVFKKQVGKSPSEYRKTLKREREKR